LLAECRNGIAKFETEEDFVGRRLGGGICSIIDNEFSLFEILGPVVLTFIYKESQNCLEVLIRGFGLTIRLRMIGGGEE